MWLEQAGQAEVPLAEAPKSEFDRKAEHGEKVVKAGGKGETEYKVVEDEEGKLVKVRVGIADKETAEGRTGGHGGRKIVYDDAAIDALLDRSYRLP